MKKVSIFFIVTTILFAACNMAAAEMIGLDAVHGAGTPESLGEGAWYAMMRTELEADGHTLQILYDFEADSLATCDIVFLSQARGLGTIFTGAEITSLHAYVADGNSLVAFAEGGYATDDTVANFNELLAPYGIEVNGVPTAGNGHIVTDFVTHELTSEIETIGIDFHRSLVSIASPGVDLTAGGGENNILAMAENGGGNVIVMSDSATFCTAAASQTTINDEDNLKLLKNISTFLSVPEPSMIFMIFIGVLSLIWLRGKSR